MSLLRRARRPLAVAATLLALVLGSTACLPQTYDGSRFESCQLVWHDATVSSWRDSPLQPHLAELQRLTGIRFTAGTEADARDHGVLIVRMQGGDPKVGGTTTFATSRIDGRTTVRWATISLRDGASAGMRRHELGHLFNLAHNDGSALMRPAPSPTATYSPLERDAMRAMAVRSGCR